MLLTYSVFGHFTPAVGCVAMNKQHISGRTRQYLKVWSWNWFEVLVFSFGCETSITKVKDKSSIDAFMILCWCRICQQFIKCLIYHVSEPQINPSDPWTYFKEMKWTELGEGKLQGKVEVSNIPRGRSVNRWTDQFKIIT